MKELLIIIITALITVSSFLCFSDLSGLSSQGKGVFVIVITVIGFFNGKGIIVLFEFYKLIKLTRE